MNPLDQLISPLVRDMLWYALIVFGWWALGYEVVVVLLLALIAKRLK